MIFSKLKPFVGTVIKYQGPKLMSGGHHTFPLAPSRWQWTRFKDLFHYYVLLGVIPLVVLTTGANVFIGPATLSEIPEEYEPKHWEYYKSPITRFIARYILPSPQQEYEKFLTYHFVEHEKQLLRQIEKDIKAKMAERDDYKAYYYRPVFSKYSRIQKESLDNLKQTTMSGD